MSTCLPILAFFLLAFSQLGAQTLVLKAARLFDGKSEVLVQPAVVVVTGNRITAVGPNVAVPEGARVVDLGDATLLPGLMDAHTHIASGGMDDSRARTLERLQKPVAQRALEAVAHARATLMAGFTTIRDLGSQEQIDVGLRNAIRSGAIQGPRILPAVRSVGTTGGHCDGSNGFAPGILGGSS
jgi:imidazolonepropionase-like amidohydrolase